MNFRGIGDTIGHDDYNAFVYLLRKFKRLTSDLKLGNNVINSDYGSYTFNGDLINIDGNFILESPVTITSNNALLNCFYTFNFTVIDVNTSSVVNKRIGKVTGSTGDNGVLSVTIPTNFIDQREVILPDFTVDIVFDEHEYYTPTSTLNITLGVEKDYIIADETNIITATVTTESGTPKSDVFLSFVINGEVYATDTTDNDGVASIIYTGIGTRGKTVITVSQISKVFYDGGMVAEYTGNSINLAKYASGDVWLVSDGNVIIDWGDSTTSTVNNPTTPLTHTYNDNQTEHTINFIGDITMIGDACFYECTGLKSIVIPSSVTNIGTECFAECNNLVDYQLYWTGNNIIEYDNTKMPDNNNAIFIIPEGETSNYILKEYLADKLQERIYHITIAIDKTIIQTGEAATITAGLKYGNQGVSGESLSYQIKHGSTVIDSGTDTTDDNGEITIEYESTGLGEVEIIINGMSLQQTYTLEDVFVFDKGTSSDHNDSAWKNFNNLTVTRNTDDTTVTNNLTTQAYLYTNKIGTSTDYDWDTPLCLEFDYEHLTPGKNISVQLYDVDNDFFASWLTKTGHYKIQVKAGEVEWWINNTQQTSKTVEIDTTMIRFYFQGGASFKFSNLKIYSLED